VQVAENAVPGELAPLGALHVIVSGGTETVSGSVMLVVALLESLTVNWGL